MRTTRWQPETSSFLEGLRFLRSIRFLELYEDLLSRPRAWWRKAHLPLIFIVVPAGSPTPLDAMSSRVRQSVWIPRSRVGSSVQEFGRLLDTVVADFYRRRRPLRSRVRFAHYSFVKWLIGLRVSPHTQRAGRHAGHSERDETDSAIEDGLEDFLRQRHPLLDSDLGSELELADEFPWAVRVIAKHIPKVALAVMKVSWRPTRWFKRHPITAVGNASFGEKSRDFVQRHSAASDLPAITASEIEQLLVDALVEDLRIAFRRTTVLGCGRRRLYHGLLVVDNADADTTSLRLVELLASALDRRIHRSPRARSNPTPLLVVATGTEAGLSRLRERQLVGRAPVGTSELRSISDFAAAFGEWLGWNTAQRAKILPVEFPARDRLVAAEGLESDAIELKVPGWRPLIASVLVPALVAAGIVAASTSNWGLHCGSGVASAPLSGGLLTQYGDQCVGVSVSGPRFLQDLHDATGLSAEDRTALANIETDIDEDSGRALTSPQGHVTIVYLGPLADRDREGLLSQLEDLRGLSLVQRRAAAQGKPLRVLLANGGPEMRYGKEAAERIVALSATDPTIVGVVGLGVSKRGTKEAIAALGNAGIPVLGTAISATDIAIGTSQYYYQVSPTNAREASVAADYAKTAYPDAQVVQVVSPDDPDDLYTSDMAKQAFRAFDQPNYQVEDDKYSIAGTEQANAYPSPAARGSEACQSGPTTLVFWAGRSEQLGEFLDSLNTTCQGKAAPHILAGDDTVRFVLARGSGYLPDLQYLSFATSLSNGSNCADGLDKSGFYQDFGSRFGAASECADTRDGEAILAFDSLSVFARAINTSVMFPPSRDQVRSGIEAIDAVVPLFGASGQIAFPRSGVRSVPSNKSVLVLSVKGTDPPLRVWSCESTCTGGRPPLLSG